MKKKAFSVSVEKDPRTASIVKTARYMLDLAIMADDIIGSFLSSGQNPYYLAKYLQGNFAQLKKYDSMLMFNKATNSVPGMNRLITQAHKALYSCIKVCCINGTTTVETKTLTNSDKQRAADEHMKTVISMLEALLGMRTHHSKEVMYDKEDRLNNQIFRPDIWFAAPPMCNVLFPECYSRLDWSRNYLREVSRMELQTTNEIIGDDALFNGRYYAPDVKDTRRNIKLSSRLFAKFIMQHELFTGIIPMFEKMSEVNLFAMKSKKINEKGAKVGYAQRAVNFQYFKHRFASRQMAAAGRFNPWFAAGFPALVIDKPMGYDNLAVSGLTIEEQLFYLGLDLPAGVKPTRAVVLRELIPTQYLGHCIQLSHTLNQEGGNTQYAFTEARIHRESSEFLGVDKATVSRANGTAKKVAVYAALPSASPKKNGRGPRGGVINNVKDVTNKYKGRYLTFFPAGKVSVRVGDSGQYAPQDYYFSETTGGGQQTLNREPQSVAIQTGETFRAYQITETFTKRIREEVDLPIEDAVRPPWIWDGWQNLRIGETYMQF
jgi:hypothetical protein